jgi:hypothetical protein
MEPLSPKAAFSFDQGTQKSSANAGGGHHSSKPAVSPHLPHKAGIPISAQRVGGHGVPPIYSP